jgi:diadenylate cyclase
MLDILIMSILIYQLYSWFRNSRAIQVLAGLGTVTAIYFITRQTGLHMTSWVLQQLSTVIIVLIVVVFQNEIRQTLYRFSKLRELVRGDQEQSCSMPGLIAEAVFDLANERSGAIIIFQRTDLLDDHLSNGILLDALISIPLLRSIFHDGTPLHDGAVLVRDERVIQAACLLPLSDSLLLPQQYGTRHRAAIGLTERTDAVALVVSEERGTISLAERGKLTSLATAEELANLLEMLMSPAGLKQQSSFLKRLFSNLLPKTAVVLSVSVIWFLLSIRQGEVAIVPVPLTFHGLPNGMTLTRVSPEEVTVRLRSTSGLVPSPRQLDLTADLDLGNVQEGQNTLRVSLSHVQVPSGMSVIGIEPTTVRIVVRSSPKSK